MVFDVVRFFSLLGGRGLKMIFRNKAQNRYISAKTKHNYDILSKK